MEGRRVASQLVRVAKERGAHSIVMGHSPSYARWLPWREDVVANIMRYADDIQIVVAPVSSADATHEQGAQERRSRRSPFRVVPRWVSVALILFSAVLLGAVVDRFSGRDANTIMILLAGVLFSSTVGGRIAGLTSSLLAVLAFNFFFTDPRFTLVVDDTSYLVTFPVMLIVAFVTSELMSRLNASVALARKRQERAEVLYRNSEQLLSARSAREICDAAIANLQPLLQRGVTILTSDTDESEPTHDREEGDGTMVEIATDTTRFGAIRIRDDGSSLTVGNLALVNAIAAQLAIALDRERLTQAEERARLHAERERVRANLLRSVSHDLRTPLSAIAGAASAIREVAELPPAHRQLVTDIEGDAMWLSEIVDNILSLTRLNDDTVSLHAQEEVLEDIILESIERVSRRAPSRRFEVTFPDEIVLVDVDVSLIEQMLINVLANAIDFSPEEEPVVVRVSSPMEGRVLVSVTDRGRGMDPDAIDRAFDLFFTQKSGDDSRRGLGVGLTVSKTVVELHGGAIELRNAEPRGLTVGIALPAKSAPVQEGEG